MAELRPQRTKTSSTIGDRTLTEKELDEAQQRLPVTPTRTRNTTRRVTLSHRKLVFYDPVAFRYLEEDDSTIVLARRERLQGYELYVVEQWACSRVHPTFVITTYTGDPSHSILVNVLAVPYEEKNWSKRLKIYFDAVSQFHAREQETPLGTLMVTNLSAFPSALTVISVPDGDVRKHREDFIVNEDLKRMGCAGRAAMNLHPAAPSTMSKFHHLYQISESIPFKASVMELVKMCQYALVLYGKLNSIYVDGLLCDITEKAINDWWNDIGTDFHNIEPSDGVLGPSTVSALLGLMIGAYNRIRASGINIPKDIVDTESMKRAISQFQKAYKIERTRRLDRVTLDRLHRVTAKSANSEGWAIPRAVKSTVAGLSGKGGEMVMDAIGANKEKAAISEVETLDIEKLAQLVQGPKMKWLWHGKPLKASRNDGMTVKDDEGLNGRVFGTDDRGNYLWMSKNRDSIFDADDGDDVNSNDKAKVGRLRGMRGLRSHNNRGRKASEEPSDPEDGWDEAQSNRTSKDYSRTTDNALRSTSSFYSRSSMDRKQSDRPAFDLALANADAHSPQTPFADQMQAKLQKAFPPADGNSSEGAAYNAAREADHVANKRRRAISELNHLRDEVHGDLYQKFATEFDDQEPEEPMLRHSKSAVQLRDIEAPIAHNLRLPRQLSFSLVEPSVLRFRSEQDDLILRTSNIDDHDMPVSRQLTTQDIEARRLQRLAAHIIHLEQTLLRYAEAEVIEVEALDHESRDHLADLNNLYYQRLDDYQSLQATSRDLIAREKGSLSDGIRRVDMLGAKLDYELNALHSRMQEVEDGATEFERNVVEIEARVVELVHEKHGVFADQIEAVEDKTIPWFQRVINFFGSRSK